MTVNRENLYQHFEKHVGADAARQHMEDLESLFQQAERDKFVFDANPDPEHVRQIIRVTTGIRRPKVDFVSVSQPRPWLGRPPQAYEGPFGFWRALLDDLRESQFRAVVRVDQNLGDRLYPDRWNLKITDQEWSELREVFNPSLGHDLHRSFREGVGREFMSLIGERFSFCLWDVPFYYCAYACKGDEYWTTMISALLRIIARNPISGERACEPGTWVGLKA